MADIKYTKSFYAYTDEATLCGICKEILFEPVCPSCEHAFCGQCLLTSIDAAVQKQKVPSCPLCGDGVKINVDLLYEMPSRKPRVNLALRRLGMMMMGEDLYNHRLNEPEKLLKVTPQDVMDYITENHPWGIWLSNMVHRFTMRDFQDSSAGTRKRRLLTILDGFVAMGYLIPPLLYKDAYHDDDGYTVLPSKARGRDWNYYRLIPNLPKRAW